MSAAEDIRPKHLARFPDECRPLRSFLDWVDEEIALDEEGLFDPYAFTYFIEGEGHGPIKIGSARNVEVRRSELQIGSPVPLSVIDRLRGGRWLERSLKRRFAHDRLHGEWFARTPDLLACIVSLAALVRDRFEDEPEWVERRFPIESEVGAVVAARPPRPLSARRSVRRLAGQPFDNALASALSHCVSMAVRGDRAACVDGMNAVTAELRHR